MPGVEAAEPMGLPAWLTISDPLLVSQSWPNEPDAPETAEWRRVQSAVPALPRPHLRREGVRW